MTMMVLPTSEARPLPGERLGAELRDGLLQDLVAVGMLVNAARRMLDAGDEGASSVDPAHDLLSSASHTISADLVHVRDLIGRLGLPE